MHPEYGYYYLNKNSDVSPFSSSNKCPSGTKCFIWVNIAVVPDDILAKQLDNFIDNGDGQNAGDFRWHFVSDTWKWNYAYKYAPIKNPNE